MTTAARQALSTSETNRPVLPGLGVMSDAFKAGYDTVSTGEYVGWPIQHAPNERSITQFIKDAVAIISADTASGHDCEYEIKWIAGLLTGWLRREQ
jgi:hypothetical protein